MAKKESVQTSYGVTYGALSPERLPTQLGLVNSLICEMFHKKTERPCMSYVTAQFLLKQDFDTYDLKS
jgi:hypothetical protein